MELRSYHKELGCFNRFKVYWLDPIIVKDSYTKLTTSMEVVTKVFSRELCFFYLIKAV